MRKFYLTMLSALALSTVQAQTLLDEDFETGNTGSSPTPVAKTEGWTTVNSYSGTKATYTWHNYYSDPEAAGGPTISGACCAAVDGPIGSTDGDGVGPREEILLSPELNLDDTYQLQFTWRVSPMNADEKSRYDLQVRIVEGDNLQGAETVFSIQDQNMLRESGVNVFPITTWDPHTSKVDLSDWKGSKVRIAFVYKMFTEMANVVWLDDVSVKQFTPATGPVASVSLDRYNFGNIYVGEKLYTEVIRLTNTGKDGLKITGTDFPQGIATTLDLDAVNLRTNESVTFQLSYTASLFSPAQGNAVLHTTGGDVTIAYSATKEAVPEGYTLETFNDYFPPAGWRNNGWNQTNAAIEGDGSVYCSGDFSGTASYLRSPRLDLSDGGKVTFSYYNQYDGEYAPEYDIELQVSYDGGDTWTTKWTSDYQSGLNQMLTETVDLGLGSDESYVRWFYPAVEDDDEGAYDLSTFTLDRVLLPNVYGANGVPGNATVISPSNGATNIYPKDIVLKWAPAQFATGYKLFVGSNAEANDLIEDLNVGNALTYTIPAANYETTYRWKVVPYNEKGECTTASTWRFTTQPDASVMEFPYEENFDECTKEQPVPTGWLSVTNGQYDFAKWSPNSYYPYGGKGASLASGHLNAGEAVTLTSPEFTLPADGKTMSISFVWGNAHPSDLMVDETGLLKKQNVEGGNGYDEVVFEIFSDGQWEQASILSEAADADGKKYWRNEYIDLDKYAGKTIQFRWITRCFVTYKGYGTLDNIVIDGNVADRAVFNKDGWDAGKVNFGKAVNSGEQFTMLNKGKNTLKVKAVSFTNDNFTASIAEGQEIPAGEGIAFSLQFNANETVGQVEDKMVVEFESGATAEFPVKGEALDAKTHYYAFEPNPLDYEWKTDFTQIDVDNKATYQLGYYLTEVENDGGRYAFTQVTNNNVSMLAAVSGNHTIAAAAPADNSAADDWLISKKFYVGEGATFDFYARNLGTQNSVFVGDNDLHRVAVLVSEKEPKTADFTSVMRETEMPYLAENQWNHYVVDLANYAGKELYIAVRHTTVTANWMAFFDDFTFKGVIERDPCDVNADGTVDVADIAAVIDVMAGTAEKGFADVNGDNSTDVADISMIIDAMAGTK